MSFAELFGIVFITEFFVAKLFAGQIKNAVADNIVAVVVAALTIFSPDFREDIVKVARILYFFISRICRFAIGGLPDITSLSSIKYVRIMPELVKKADSELLENVLKQVRTLFR